MDAVFIKDNFKTDNGKTYKSNRNTINFIGAIGGITGGLILMLTGIILSAIAYFDRMSFHGGEVILIVSAFVFLAIGAHFLDSMENRR
ncbi:MAG: hypothetical protein ACR2L1_09290 [Pyrinomonadaceae bacterium]